MNKINTIGFDIGASQQAMLAKMQQAAALASSGIHPAAPSTVLASSFSETAATNAYSFSQVLNQAIDNVDALQHAAAAKQQAIEMGQSDDLAGAMIETQKASVMFSAMMQVRNKLTTALDEVMNTSL